MITESCVAELVDNQAGGQAGVQAGGQAILSFRGSLEWPWGPLVITCAPGPLKKSKRGGDGGPMGTLPESLGGPGWDPFPALDSPGSLMESLWKRFVSSFSASRFRPRF